MSTQIVTKSLNDKLGFAISKSSLFNSLVLVVTCGGITAQSFPAKAASFTGFGCSDNFSCGSYLEFSNANVVVGVGNGAGGGVSDSFSLPVTRTGSPILYGAGSSGSPSIPLGTRTSLSLPYNETFKDILVTESGLAEVPLWNVNGLAFASLESVLNLGQLKATASTSVEVSTTPLSDRGAGGGSAVAYAQMSLGWGDTITVTSNSHALGDFVPFEVRLFLDRFVVASGRFGGNSQAFVSGELFGSYIPNLAIFDSNFYPSNVTELTTIAYLPIGELSTIEGRLQVFASAFSVAAWPDQLIDSDHSIANASHTANYYLTPLVEGVSYTSASGRTYFYSGNSTPVPTPALLPGLIGLGLNLWRKRRNEAQEKQMP